MSRLSQRVGLLLVSSIGVWGCGGTTDEPPTPGCNDGILQTTEACEGFELRGETCESQGFAGGRLRCNDSCGFDTSACFLCGDGIVSGIEMCDGNVIGSNLGWRARWSRFVRMLRGEYREWNALNVAALASRAAVLTAANRAVLEAFDRARRSATPWMRMAWLRRSGVFRQKPSEQFMLWVACLLRRM